MEQWVKKPHWSLFFMKFDFFLDYGINFKLLQHFVFFLFSFCRFSEFGDLWYKTFWVVFGKNYNIDTCGLYYKSFTIVIYDRNDSTIVEPLL